MINEWPELLKPLDPHTGTTIRIKLVQWEDFPAVRGKVMLDHYKKQKDFSKKKVF